MRNASSAFNHCILKFWKYVAVSQSLTEVHSHPLTTSCFFTFCCGSVSSVRHATASQTWHVNSLCLKDHLQCMHDLVHVLQDAL